MLYESSSSVSRMLSGMMREKSQYLSVDPYRIAWRRRLRPVMVMWASDFHAAMRALTSRYLLCHQSSSSRRSSSDDSQKGKVSDPPVSEAPRDLYQRRVQQDTKRCWHVVSIATAIDADATTYLLQLLCFGHRDRARVCTGTILLWLTFVF